jgi:arylsulfatase A-like enzyme
MVSSDHGENLGELGIYCDHQTADQFTTRLPVVLRWPGLDTSTLPAQDGLHYQIDVMATVLELSGATVPETWDGRSFAPALTAGEPSGRQHLVLSHAAWTAQRSVRLGNWLCMETYWDAFHGFPEVMLFDLADDPYEQHDLAPVSPDVVQHALLLLHEWKEEAMSRSSHGIDPMWSVLHEGGPWHSRVDVGWYLERLRATGRGQWADRFEARGPLGGGSAFPSSLDPTM